VLFSAGLTGGADNNTWLRLQQKQVSTAKSLEVGCRKTPRTSGFIRQVFG
jgi:hypothetical protein